MQQARKITVHILPDLLEQAQKNTGQGITETIRQGLQLVAAQKTYKDWKAWRGGYKFSIDLKHLRED